MVGYVLLGLALGELSAATGAMGSTAHAAFELLASLGLVALLFRVGVASHPRRLWRKLPDASLIWLGNVTVFGLLGFLAAHYLLELTLVPALITATALIATSIGVAVPVWEQTDRSDTDDGALTSPTGVEDGGGLCRLRCIRRTMS